MNGPPHRIWPLLLAPCGLAIAVCAPAPEREPGATLRPTGLVVERVTAGGAAALAGVEEGDLLVSWRRRGEDGVEESGDFARLFDPHWVEVLQGSRGGLVLVVSRHSEAEGGRSLELPISGNTWRMWARPLLPSGVEPVYRASLARLEPDDPASAKTVADELLEIGRGLASPELQVAAALHAGRLLRERAPGQDPGETFAIALSVAEASDDPALLAWASQEAGWAAQQARRLPDALRHHGRALELYERLAPATLLVANALQETALLRAQLGELPAAVAAMQEVLAVRRRLAPESLVVAATLNNLGNYVSDLAEQQRYHEEALALRERLAPGSLDTASSLNNLGNVRWARGDLRRAEELLERSRALLEELEAPPRFRGGVTGNLALVARERGDLARAEGWALEALRIFEQHEPRGPFHAETLNSIGLIRRERADLEGAESSFREALAVAREIAETSPRTANALLNLGSTLSQLGRHEEAESMLREGAAIQERLDPRAVEMASVWTALAGVAREQGDEAEEERLLRAALSRFEDQAPESLLVARALDHLGSFLEREGEVELAASLLARALALAERIAPGTLDEARIAQHLARATSRQGRPGEALALYDRAVAALESQTAMLGGGDETRSQFRAANQELHEEHIELLLEQDLVEQAFAALERSRAQAFVAWLAERDLVFARELPEDLAERRARLEQEYDRTLGELATLSPRDSPTEGLALRERLLELRRQHEALVTELRTVSPELASLRYPRSGGPAEASRSLRPGTVLLEYRIGEHAGQLFALSHDGSLTVHELGVGDRELQELVDRLVLLLRAGGGVAASDPGGSTAMVGELSRELYRALISPARARLAAAKSLAIVPDGPLHALPFGALVEPESGRYLIERFAYTVVPSAEALASLLERPGLPSGESGRPPSRAPDVVAVALGDPTATGHDALPWSRAEVRSIERTLERPVRALVGADATEESVEALGGSVPYLHFAVHGVLDANAPLDSALVLGTAAGSSRNGLLQAWEVLERVRVDADLAVLSGCETGLGENRAGEGLVGLVRAFHFAGARAVIASLWRVYDRGTAVLMARLYQHLEAGEPPSEALRAAQLELLRGSPEALAAWSDLESPGYGARVLEWLRLIPKQDAAGAERLRQPTIWAAFQVYGGER